ncbi:MAG: zinc ribbon domain-containing protein [Blastocatellales bacterium]
MYCPRCGNQPASDRVRFCPSCGFRLDGVVDLLVRDGVPTNPLNSPQVNIPQSNQPSERKRGIRRGAKITFASVVMFIPFFAISIADNHPGPLVVPMTIFLAGIFWMLYYRLFGDEQPSAPKQVQPPQFISPPQNAYLPPQSIPAYRSPVETPQEHSVAEHTTRSLGQQ